MSMFILQTLYQLKCLSHHFSPFSAFSWCFQNTNTWKYKKAVPLFRNLQFHQCLNHKFFVHFNKSPGSHSNRTSQLALLSPLSSAGTQACSTVFFFFNLLLCVFILIFLLYLAFTDLLLALTKLTFFQHPFLSSRVSLWFPTRPYIDWKFSNNCSHEPFFPLDWDIL